MNDNLKKHLLNLDKIENLISILFWGRSGSYLLCSLLDGHRELLQFPCSNWDSYYNEFEEITNYVKENTFANSINFICKKLPLLFKEYYTKDTEQLVGKSEGYGVDKNKFMETMDRCFTFLHNNDVSLNTAMLISLLHIVYEYTLKGDVKDINYKIVLSLHCFNPLTLKKIKKDFPKSIFLLAVRFPEKTLDSHLRHHFYENIVSPETLTYTLLKLMIDTGQSLAFLKKEDTLAIRFEDMHTCTEKVMRHLSKKIDITWDSCLCTSTMGNHPLYFPNPKKNNFITGTNPNILKKNNCSILSKIDTFKIRYILENFYIHWNYSKYSTFKNKLKMIFVFFLTFFLINQS